MTIKPLFSFVVMSFMVLASVAQRNLHAQAISVTCSTGDTTPLENWNEVSEGWVYDIALNPIGDTLALATDQGVVFYDPETLRRTGQLEGHDSSLTSESFLVAWSPDGKYLAEVKTLQADFYPNILRIWNLETHEVNAHLDLGGDFMFGYPHTLSWSPIGDWIAIEGSLPDRLWNISSVLQSNVDLEAIILSTTGGNDLEANSLNRYTQKIAWSPDGRYLALPSGNVIKVWDIYVQRELLTLRNEEHSEALTLDWSPNGKLLATGGKNFTRVWDTETWSLIQSSDGNTDNLLDGFAPRTLRWSPTGNTLAVGVSMVLLMNTESYSISGQLQTGEPPVTNDDFVRDLEWMPDGVRLFSFSYGGLLQLWDTQNQCLIAALRSPRPVQTGIP